MKRILIVTYYWPPSAGSGVQRWLKFAKYLPQFGWQPVIFTPENPDFGLQDRALLDDIPKEVELIKTKIWEPYSIAKILSSKKENIGQIKSSENQNFKTKILNYIRGNFFIPDPRIFWVKPSIKFLLKYLKNNTIDAIVTTGPPHSMHLIGLGIKKVMPDLNWIVDIRDPWSKIDFLDTYGITKSKRIKYIQQEKQVLKSCDLVIGTSFSMPEMLVGFDQAKYHTITNGYDVDDFKNFNYNFKKQDDSFTIFYAGLMNELRNPENLWIALSEYCKENSKFKDKLKIHLVGNIAPEVAHRLSIDKHIQNCVKIESYKAHEKILKLYQQADILLLLINDSINSKVNIPGKLFELLVTGKPILAFGNHEDDAIELVKKYEHCHTSQYDQQIDIDEILKLKSPKNKHTHSGHDRKTLTHLLVNLIS